MSGLAAKADDVRRRSAIFTKSLGPAQTLKGDLEA
jgi:hypothetical protein